MYGIDNASSTSSLPAYGAAGTSGYFQDTAPAGGTVLPAWWANMVQRELMNVVTGAGLTPSKASDNQLYSAISAMISAAIASATASLTPQQYAIGDVFITQRSGDPSALLGYGTWTRTSSGRVLIGYDATDPDFSVVGNTGGRKFIPADGWNNADGTVSQKSNTYLWGERGTTDGPPSPDPAAGALEAGRLIIASGNKEQEEGLESLAYAGVRSGASNKPRDSNVTNMPPYFVVNIWLRTA